MPDEYLWYLEAFWTLNTSRQLGFDCVGYIPMNQIESFCRLYDVQDIPMFVQVMRHLDRLFVDFQNNKLKAQSKAKK